MKKTIQRGFAFLVMLLTICASAVLWVAPAQAHDVLLESDPAHNQILPAMPEVITLTYNNKLMQVPGASLIEVRDSAGKTVLSAQPKIDGPQASVQLKDLPTDAVYRVVWRVVSSDSHPIDGSFNFGVGSATEAQLAELPPAVSPGANALKLSVQAAAKATEKNVYNQQQAVSGAPDGLQVVLISIAAVLVAAIAVAAVVWFNRSSKQDKQQNN